MEETKKIETFRTTFVTNIWLQRGNLLGCLMAIIIALVANLNFLEVLGLLLCTFLFMTIAIFGFIGIYAHVIYYFRYEENRTVELYNDKISTRRNDHVIQEMFKNDIARIVLCDKLKSDGINLFPTNSDSYYYLVIIGKNNEQIVLTSLLDIRLKQKIMLWFGRTLDHDYRFFPVPNRSSSK